MQNFLDTSVKRICKLAGVEADDAITSIREPSITFFVSGNSSRGEVMFSIHFYDELGRMNCEIRNIRAYRCLAANVNSIEFFEFSQIVPEALFTISHAVAKLSRPSQGSG